MPLSTSKGEYPSSLSVFMISGSDIPCEKSDVTFSVGILGAGGAGMPPHFFLDRPNINKHQLLYLTVLSLNKLFRTF
jgi:hypothetical protein